MTKQLKHRIIIDSVLVFLGFAAGRLIGEILKLLFHR